MTPLAMWPPRLQAAERLLIRVLDAADTLAQMAERGRIVPEIGDAQIRELIVSPYRLMYRVGDSEVHICHWYMSASSSPFVVPISSRNEQR